MPIFLVLLIATFVGAIRYIVKNAKSKDKLPPGIHDGVFRRNVEEQRRREGARISGADVVIQLEKLRHLKDKGVFTEIEYVARKGKVLDELKDKVITDTPEDFLMQFIPLVENETLSPAEIAQLKAIALAVEAQLQVPAASQPAQVQMVPCPGCGKPGHPKATVCGYCWSKL